MNAYDSWLEEPYQSSWDEDENEDPRMEFCQDEYMTNEEVAESLREFFLEEQYELYCNSLNAD